MKSTIVDSVVLPASLQERRENGLVEELPSDFDRIDVTGQYFVTEERFYERIKDRLPIILSNAGSPNDFENVFIFDNVWGTWRIGREYALHPGGVMVIQGELILIKTLNGGSSICYNHESNVSTLEKLGYFDSTKIDPRQWSRISFATSENFNPPTTEAVFLREDFQAKFQEMISRGRERAQEILQEKTAQEVVV